MDALHIISLIAIAATWLYAWRLGQLWCHICGVKERTSIYALGCILLTAGLIVSVHLLAFIALLSSYRPFTPTFVAVVFAILTLAARHMIVTRIDTPVNVRCEKPVCVSPFYLGRWWVPIIVVLGMYAIFLADAVTRYPTGWDGLNYHLLVAVGWARDQSMNMTYAVMHQCFPENGMIVSSLLAFAKIDRLFTVVHFPKAMLLSLVIYGLSRGIGVSRYGSIASACVALSIPVVVFQSFSSYIDLYAAVSWLSGLLALIWMTRVRTREQRLGLLVMAGLSAGVALGSKTTYLVLVPMLGLMAVLGEWIRPQVVCSDRRRPLRVAAVFATAAMACSLFWFVRGTIQAGNPVYPLAVSIAGQKILPGNTAEQYFPVRDFKLRITRWWDYFWREPKIAGPHGYPYGLGSGLGAAYATFVPIGILATFASGIRKRRWSRIDHWKLVYAAGATAGIAILLTIFHEMLRFVLPLVLLAVPVGAVLIDRLLVRAKYTTLTLLTASLVITVGIATLQPAHALAGRVRSKIWQRASFYEIPELFDKLEKGTRVLNLASPSMNFPLLGRHLQNTIVTHQEWCMILNDEPISAQALWDHEIDYIYVRSPWPDDWPSDLPVKKIFDDTWGKRLASTTPTQVYRVLSTYSGGVLER